jgi:hypothetical protein
VRTPLNWTAVARTVLDNAVMSRAACAQPIWIPRYPRWSVHEILLCPEVRFGRLHPCVPQEHLDLLQLSAGCRHAFAHERRQSWGAR